MPELKIEAGRFYRTRDGYKARVYATNCGCFSMVELGGCRDVNQNIHGALLIANRWVFHAWDCDGISAICDPGVADRDLVAPWSDPPVVDWDKFPEHIVALAMDEYGGWYGFMEPPIRKKGANGRLGSWSVKKPYHAFTIRDEEEPIFSGDWRDSLVIRPGHEERKE